MFLISFEPARHSHERLSGAPQGDPTRRLFHTLSLSRPRGATASTDEIDVLAANGLERALAEAGITRVSPAVISLSLPALPLSRSTSMPQVGLPTASRERRLPIPDVKKARPMATVGHAVAPNT